MCSTSTERQIDDSKRSSKQKSIENTMGGNGMQKYQEMSELWLHLQASPSALPQSPEQSHALLLLTGTWKRRDRPTRNRHASTFTTPFPKPGLLFASLGFWLSSTLRFGHFKNQWFMNSLFTILSLFITFCSLVSAITILFVPSSGGSEFAFHRIWEEKKKFAHL